MAQQVFGPSAVVSVLNRAFTNTSPSNAVFANQVATAGTTEASQLAFAKSFGASFATGKTAADLSALLMTNMGITNAALSTALTDYIAANGTQNVGIIAWQLSSILSNLENDGTYGAAAKAWNAEVTAAYEYSADVKNTTPSTGATNGNEAGKSQVLTVAQDVLTGGAGNDNFRGVAGQAVGNQEQTTFNSSDIIDGGLGQDALILNLVGNYNGGARVKGIETLTLGTNVAAGLGLWSSQFDFNVNEGSNEISDVQTIEYDQINAGEALQVNNIVKTAGAAGGELATLLWDNEAGSAAGTIDANYRASAVAGATNQNVILDDVAALNVNLNSGRLNLGGGVETITITSAGNTANTLNNSFNVDGRNADLVSGSNDGVNDNGALTKVVVKGAQAFGRAAAVVTNDAAGEANFGLTNRAVGNDLGLTNTLASASNLISVAGTVTEIDATEADGGVAMRFVGRADNGAVNVTFKGGKAADYIEFERGNINAAGGEGADTFAFVNNALTSFDFGSADTIVGGAGSDTIQLGVNGIGNVVANTTEFNNKTGVDVLDLRGAVNTVTLADAFVAGADAGAFTVRTDKIVQTSDAATGNPTPSLAANNRAAEDNSVNTIVLTELADNRALRFIGGSGRDQVVVDNASANQYAELDGGSNNGTAATGQLNANDSLTVVDTAVLDANDVRNIKNFEFINLVETALGNSNFTLTLSEAFVLANNNGLVIGSTTGTYGQRLQAGDVVNLEVSDLQTTATSGVLKPSLAARTVNVADLLAAGVTVNYQVNGVTVSSGAAVPAWLAGRIVTNVAPAATILDDVAGATVLAATNATIANGTDDITGTTGSDTVTVTTLVLAAGSSVSGLAGTDTLVLDINGANNLTNVSSFEVINFTGAALAGTVLTTADALVDAGATLTVNGGVLGGVLNVTFAAETNGNVNVTGGSAADLVTGGAGADTIDGGLGADQLDGGAGNDSLTGGMGDDQIVTGTGNNVANGGDGNDSVTGGAGNDTIDGGAGNDQIVAGGGADVLNGGAGNDSITVGAGSSTVDGGAGTDTIGIAASTFGTGLSTINNFNVADDTFQTGTAGATVYTINVATSDTVGLLGNINTGIAGIAGHVAAAGNVYVITVAAGEAAGQYLAQDSNAVVGLAATDVAVKVVGLAGGVVTGADFIV